MRRERFIKVRTTTKEMKLFIPLIDFYDDFYINSVLILMFFIEISVSLNFFGGFIGLCFAHR